MRAIRNGKRSTAIALETAVGIDRHERQTHRRHSRGRLRLLALISTRNETLIAEADEIVVLQHRRRLLERLLVELRAVEAAEVGDEDLAVLLEYARVPSRQARRSVAESRGERLFVPADGEQIVGNVDLADLRVRDRFQDDFHRSLRV